MLELITCACFIGLLRQFSRSLSLCLPVCCSFKYNVVPHSHQHNSHLSAPSSQGPLTPLICCLFLLLLFSAYSSSSSIAHHPPSPPIPPLLLVPLICLGLSPLHGSPRLRSALSCLIYPILSPWLGGGELCNTQTLLCVYVCMYVTTGMYVCVTVFACVCPPFPPGVPRRVWCSFVCAHVCPRRSPTDHLQQPDNGARGWRRARRRYVPGSAVWPLLQRPPNPQHGGGGAPAHQSRGQRATGGRHAIILHHPAVQRCSRRQPIRLCPLDK